MLGLVDYYGGTFLIFLLAIVEMIGIFWIYGLENFCHDIEYMSKRHVTVYWRLCWNVITPIFMIVVFIYSLFGNYLQIKIRVLVFSLCKFFFYRIQMAYLWRPFVSNISPGSWSHDTTSWSMSGHFMGLLATLPGKSR